MHPFIIDRVYPIKIGSSIKDATILPSSSEKTKLSKGNSAPPPPRNLTSYHLMRYNFEPDKIDKSAGIYLEDDSGSVTVEFAHLLDGHESHSFNGNQTPCKDMDFLLLFNPETQEFTLEKQSSHIYLRNVRKTRVTRHTAAMSSAPSSMTNDTSDTEKKKNKQKETLASDKENKEIDELDDMLMKEVNDVLNESDEDSEISDSENEDKENYI